jgi:hypothetical protein
MSASKQVALVRCSCLLLSAGCCVVAACSGFVHHWYRAQGMSDRVNTRKQACIRTLACCATQLVSCSCLGCSEYCRMHRACTGFVQHGNTNTGCKACLTASTREQACTSIFSVLQLSLCSCGCLQSILVTAVCTGFVQHVLKPGTACKVHYTDATLSNRCSDVC